MRKNSPNYAYKLTKKQILLFIIKNVGGILKVVCILFYCQHIFVFSRGDKFEDKPEGNEFNIALILKNTLLNKYF